MKALRDYGMALGIAFQLADDALDYGSDTATLGKNAGDDFNEGKATLPLLLAVQRTKGKEDLFWDRVITKGERTPEDFVRACELILGTGAVEATLDAAAGVLCRPGQGGAVGPAGQRLALGAGRPGRLRGQPARPDVARARHRGDADGGPARPAAIHHDA